MDSEHISAIISATAGLVGVILGISYVAFKEYAVNRRTRKEGTLYLGILVVSHLERFANGCVQVAQDNGTERGKPAGSDGVQHVTTTSQPEFMPLSINVDWKLLPASLLYPTLRLPDDQESLRTWLAGICENDDDYPDHTEYFWVRRKGYAELGLRAEELIRKLRAHCNMPMEEPAKDLWGRTQTVITVVQEIDENARPSSDGKQKPRSIHLSESRLSAKG